MISRHAKRLLKLRVDEIEVKARISNDTDGQGEVRGEHVTALSTLSHLLTTYGPTYPPYLPTYLPAPE